MPQNNRIFYTLLPIAFVAIGYLLDAGSTILLWIICAYFLFEVIDPWMARLTRKGLSPILAALLLVVVSSAFLFGLGYLFYRSSATLLSQLVTYKAAISHFYQKTTSQMTDWVHALSHTPNDPNTASAGDAVQSATTVKDPAGSIPQGLGDGVLSGISSIFSVLTYLALTPLLTFFMIAEKEQFAAIGTHIVNDEAKAKKIHQQISGVINSYFLGNLLLILVSFPVFTLVFWWVGVKSYVSLGLISGIFNLVPFLGFILAAILPTLDLLMNGGHIGGALILVGACFFTHFTVANVITPKVLGSKVDLNATASTIALISWGHLWGPLGLLLAIPVTAMIKITFQHSKVSVFENIAALMSENPKSLHLQGLKLLNFRSAKNAAGFPPKEEKGSRKDS